MILKNQIRLFLILAFTGVGFDSISQIQFSTDDLVFNTCEEFSIIVNLESASGFGLSQLTLNVNFDGNVLEPLTNTLCRDRNGSGCPQSLPITPRSSEGELIRRDRDTVQFKAQSSSGNILIPSGSGPIFSINFIAKKAGFSTITLTLNPGDAIDENSTPIPQNDILMSINGSATITDFTDPVISVCPQPQLIIEGVNCDAVIPDLTAQVVATDNCDTKLVVSQSPPANMMVLPGNYPVTLTVTDDSQNSATCTTTVIVDDRTVPQITTCPDSRTLTLDGNCQAILPDLTTQITATDNRDTTLLFTQNIAPGMDIGLGPVPVTITVTDEGGNTTTCLVQVTVSGWRKDFAFTKGWNLVSFPGPPRSDDLSGLMDLTSGIIWGWDGTVLVPVELNEIRGKAGYWLYFEADIILSIGGSVVTPPVPLVAGWNLVGICEENVQAGNLISVAPPVWGWNGDRVVPISNTLLPYIGYLILATGDVAALGN